MHGAEVKPLKLFDHPDMVAAPALPVPLPQGSAAVDGNENYLRNDRTKQSQPARYQDPILHLGYEWDEHYATTVAAGEYGNSANQRTVSSEGIECTAKGSRRRGGRGLRKDEKVLPEKTADMVMRDMLKRLQTLEEIQRHKTLGVTVVGSGECFGGSEGSVRGGGCGRGMGREVVG